MKLILIIIFSSVSILNYGQGIEFFQGTWQEAIEAAENEDKALFVDAYAKWCGPCKRMAKTVFTQEEVGDFFNENFINLKLDMETQDGRKFGKIYPVSAYPTLMFLDGQGKLIKKSVGGKKADGLIKLGKKILGQNDQSEKYAKKYDEGDRDFDLVYKYVKSLNNAGKNSLKISNDYLRSKPKITDKQKASFLMIATTDSDSRIYKSFLDDKKNIQKYFSLDDYLKVAKKACLTTINKSFNFDNEDLFKEAKKNYKKADKKNAKRFNVEADMKYYLETRNTKEYLNSLSKYCTKYINDNADDLNAEVKSMTQQYSKNQQALDIAEKAIERAIQLEEKTEYWLNYSQVLMLKKENEKAVDAAKKALEIASKNEQPTRKIQAYIAMIERKK